MRISINDDNPISAAIDATTTLGVQTEGGFFQHDYQIYTSCALSEDYDDSLGIGIYSSTVPVPLSWGLTFENMTGTVAAGGVLLPGATVAVPDDPTLEGQMFFAMFAVKDSAGEIIVASRPVPIMIGQ